MHIYQLNPDANHFQNLVLKNINDLNDVNRLLPGTPMGSTWRPVRVEVFRGDRRNKHLPAGDFPTFDVVPTFSARAAQVLGDLLTDHGELLPLVCEEGQYFVFNCTTFVDGLDTERSEIVYFDDGSVNLVRSYVLDSDKVAGRPVFRLRGERMLNVFVNEAFVRQVQEAGLRGFDFRQVWPQPDR